MSVSRNITEISAQNLTGPRAAPENNNGPPGEPRPTTPNQIQCRMCQRWFDPALLDDAQEIENTRRGRTFRLFLFGGSVHGFSKSDLAAKPRQNPDPAFVEILSEIIAETKPREEIEEIREVEIRADDSATLGDLFSKEK